MAKCVSHKTPVMAIYGGTFDPFHLGHQAICEAVLQQTEVSQLRLIPCSLPALKADAHASAFQRLAMLQEWRKAQSPIIQQRIEIDDVELQRLGASYTIDTIKELATEFPEYRLIFVLGLDAWQSLARWHQSDALMHRVNFWVFARKGEANETMSHGLADCQSWSDLKQVNNGYYYFDANVQVELSSSQVRRNIQSSRELLPLPIAQYIKDHGLYTAVEC